MTVDIKSRERHRVINILKMRLKTSVKADANISVPESEAQKAPQPHKLPQN